MTEFNYLEEQVLSGFTMAFFEDLDYILVIKNYTGGLMKFGKHKGCDFFNGCSETTNKITFANEFYLPVIDEDFQNNFEPSCSSGRLSKTVHKLYYYETEPIEYQYFQLGYGGREYTNYCPISEYNSINSDYLYSGHCSFNESSIDKDLEEKLGETFSSNSFCVLSSLISKDVENYELYSQLRAVCYEMICSTQSLTIKIRDNYIICPRSGGKIKPENFTGYLLCPDYNLICTGTKICNSIFDCIEKESEEKENSLNYTDYEIKTTQNSSYYISDPVIIESAWELANNGTCTKCAPHYKVFNTEENECLNAVPNCVNYTEDEGDICNQCADGYSLVKEYNNTIVCISDTIIEEQKDYYKPDGSEHYYRCNNSISSCVKCLSEDECISCEEGYYLLEGSDNKITCENIDTSKCYSVSTSDKTYYVKCDRNMDNCDTCSGSGACTTCKTNYVFIEDDHTKCEDFTTQKYYYDSTTEKYRLCANGLDNCETCAITNDNFICKQCKSDYVFKHEINIECALKSNLISNNQFYTNDSEVNYYSCQFYNDIEKCLECNNKETCTNCQDTYTLVNLNTINNKICILQEDIDEHKYYHDTTTDIYKKCSTLISECNKCSDSTTCTECLGDAKLEEHNICIPNSEVIAHLYYLDETSYKYASCSKISQCKTCLSSTNCTLCNDGYVIIEENSITTCEDFSTKKYYYDSLLNKYKECSYKFRNCEKCVVEGGNNFVCEECKSNYVFKHDNNLECSLKSELETNKEFYTNDSGKNYFSCSNSLYNDVLYCKECNERSKCSKCQLDYILVNQNTKCILKRDVDNKLIYFNPDTQIYSECSELIDLCHKCDNETTCTQCGNDGALEENDKCINKTLVENNNYFINEATHKYVSCSIINNCIKCSSSTTCLECQEGFEIKDNICQSTSGSSSNNNNKDDNKLSTGAIVGIVLGILGFLLIAAGLVYFLLNKYRKKQTLPSTIPDEEKMEEKIKEKMEEKEKEIEKKSERDDVSSNKLNDIEKINVKTKKRSIHNY